MYNYYLKRYRQGGNGKKAGRGRKAQASEKEIQEVLKRDNKCRLCGRPVLMGEKAPAPMGAVIETDSEGNKYPVHYLCYKERERRKRRPGANITGKPTRPEIYPVDLPQTINWKEYKAE